MMHPNNHLALRLNRKMTIKLNMNEFPYPPPLKIIQAAEKGLSVLNRYASPEDLELLKKLLADYSDVPKRNVILYPGSDLSLREIVHIFSKRRKVIMSFPTFFPTFFAAKQFAEKLIRINLEPPDFNLDIDFIVKELNEPCLVIIDNPNNPTGKIILNKEKVEVILENKNVLLVIDEAYYEFTKQTYAKMVENHSNLAVTRTVSKAFGLAGARIGYIIGGKTFLEAFSPLYVILAQTSLFATIEAIRNPDYIQNNIELTIRERERVKGELIDLGLQVYPSTTNFLLINTKVSNIGARLNERGISVLDLSDRWLSGFIRVAIGTKDENDCFLSNMREIINRHE